AAQPCNNCPTAQSLARLDPFHARRWRSFCPHHRKTPAVHRPAAPLRHSLKWREEHLQKPCRSTANVIALPRCCQLGQGRSGCSASRESTLFWIGRGSCWRFLEAKLYSGNERIRFALDW